MFSACLIFDDDLLRVECIRALVDLGEERALIELAALLDSPHPRQRLAALRGINGIGASCSVVACLRCLADPDRKIRRFAAIFLGWQKASSAPAALATTLRDESIDVRVAAAEAAGSLRSEATILALIRRLDDEAVVVRIAALQALSALLSTPLEIDVQQETRSLETVVERLVHWWADARVDGRPWRTPIAHITDTRAATGSEIVPLFTGRNGSAQRRQFDTRRSDLEGTVYRGEPVEKMAASPTSDELREVKRG